MATIQPTAVESSTNYAGSATVANVESEDANWAIADGNNVNTDIQVSYPTPALPLTIGAGLQLLRIECRQFDEGQGGDPDVRVELWEAGSLVRAGSAVPVTGGAQIVNFTFNANELSDTTGADLECKVFGLRSGGSPTNRNSVDIGAIRFFSNESALFVPRIHIF